MKHHSPPGAAMMGIGSGGAGTGVGVGGSHSAGSGGSHHRRRKACGILALIGALCSIILIQFILFPLMLSMVVDPFPHGRKHNHHRPQYDEMGQIIPPFSSSEREESVRNPHHQYQEAKEQHQEQLLSSRDKSNRQQIRNINNQPSDGEFNGVPIYLRTMSSRSPPESSSSQQQQHSPPPPRSHSHIHCVGENHHIHAWQQRSCQFSHFCFNLTSQDFVIFPSQQEYTLWSYLIQRPFMYISTSMQRGKFNTTDTTSTTSKTRRRKRTGSLQSADLPDPDEEAEDMILRNNTNTSRITSDTTTEENETNNVNSINDNNNNNNVTETEMLSMSIGGLNSKWNRAGIRRMKWFPKVVIRDNINDPSPLSYYALPDWVVLVPFHSLNGANPGHLVWDDFLPIYTLLSMFQLFDKAIVPLRYVLNDGEPGLWASCDVREGRTDACDKMIQKFIPLLLGEHSTIQYSSTKEYDFRPKIPSDIDLICSKTGLAGIGSLTDHGVRKSHGWEEKDYEITHNHGRGSFLFDYRNFMMQNMGLDQYQIVPTTSTTGTTKTNHRIIFSRKSSDILIRSMNFDHEIDIVQTQVMNARVESFVFKELSLREQLDAVKDAAIYITLCGGGAVTAMFLPKGASVFLYYASDGGAANNRLTHKPAMLDWDLFNAMSHLRVHWLPRNTMKTNHDATTLVLLIQHELDIIDSRAFL